MARVISHRQTRNGHWLASQEFPTLLDEAVAAPIWRSPCSRSEGKDVDRTNGEGQSLVGRSQNPWRIAQAWNRHFGTNNASMICCAVHTAVGCSVTLKCTTRLRWCASTTSTNSTRNAAVGTVKKSI